MHTLRLAGDFGSLKSFIQEWLNRSTKMKFTTKKMSFRLNLLMSVKENNTSKKSLIWTWFNWPKWNSDKFHLLIVRPNRFYLPLNSSPSKKVFIWNFWMKSCLRSIRKNMRFRTFIARWWVVPNSWFLNLQAVSSTHELTNYSEN